ncbi:Thiol:disulfide interchange protein [Tenacibaculum sp. 190130A14a]|uniref:Thiol:disulfide interchange protein n=1 Tax=Tenacibaculum polynesiense TaxID=3137857 RepID=A0ABP1EZ03_9FLAO
MKKIIALIAITLVAFACSSKKEGNMIVKGQIKGLKKGTLYLQKMKDTILVSVDSVNLLGDDKFILADNLESPVVYYITFDGNTNEKSLLFFGEQGEITINDDVETFGLNPQITGSENQKSLEQYFKIVKRFNDQNLELIKLNFNAQKSNNLDSVKLIEQKFNSLLKKRILFATNFALNNSDKEVAPYIALTELYDANIKLLDTVTNSLTDKVKNSDYGKRLQKYVTKIKKDEN